MNKRFFKDVITIYNQKSDDTFQRTVLKNVYIRKVRKSTINSKGEEVASSATIVIPTALLIDDELKILSGLTDGDYVVDKETSMDFDFRELKRQFKVYRVQSIADNRKGGLQHFKLEVVE